MSWLTWLLSLALSGAAFAPAAATRQSSEPAALPAAATAHHTGSRGADISWPNCPKGMGIPGRRSRGEPMPTRSAQFVIVGLTNGPGFHPNPCLADQIRWVRRHGRSLGAYAMTTFPTARQIRRYAAAGPFAVTGRRNQLRNTGYAQAAYNVRVAQRLGMLLPMIWVDVEPYPSNPWSRSRLANRAVVIGAIRGYRDLGYPVGIYSNPNGWPQVVGRWRLARYPTWSTAGFGRAGQARRMCSRGPSGGVTWLAQWWRGHRDLDLVCSRAPHPTHLFTAP